MGKLDTLVTDHFADRLFHPTRLAAILPSIAHGRAELALEVRTHVSALQTEVTDADETLKRLYRMVEEGITELDDIMKERLASLKLARDRSKAPLERIRTHVVIPFPSDPETIERFGRVTRETTTTGDVPFRKANIRSVVERIEVDDTMHPDHRR